MLERQWQVEFYRCASLLLSNKHFVSPDAGAVFGSSGFVDFYINDELGYAVELLREGDRLHEHIARFQGNGRYASLLPSLNDFAIVDFRDINKPIKFSQSNLFYVGYAADYSAAVFTYPDGTEEQFKLLGDQVRQIMYYIIFICICSHICFLVIVLFFFNLLRWKMLALLVSLIERKLSLAVHAFISCSSHSSYLVHSNLT